MKIIKSKEFDIVAGKGLEPTPEQLQEGDIAVNYLAGHERIFMKNSNGEIVQFEPYPKNASLNDYNLVFELCNLPIDKRMILAIYDGYLGDSGEYGRLLNLSAMPPAGTEIHIVIIGANSPIVIDTDNPDVPIQVVDGNEIIESNDSVIEVNLISNGKMVLARSIF